MDREWKKQLVFKPLRPLVSCFGLREVVAPDLIKGLGNGYYRLIKAFIQDEGYIRR